ARSVVIPGFRPRKFAAGSFGTPCALIIRERKAATDVKTSLNHALREDGGAGEAPSGLGAPPRPLDVHHRPDAGGPTVPAVRRQASDEIADCRVAGTMAPLGEPRPQSIDAEGLAARRAVLDHAVGVEQQRRAAVDVREAELVGRARVGSEHEAADGELVN